MNPSYLDYSVSKVVNKIKGVLESNFSKQIIVGEVSNLTHSSSGHWYFTLSDASASLSVAMFKSRALREPYLKKLRNGDKVICNGNIGVYSKRGSFQLICEKISPLGKGSLKEEFEKLKKKLAAQGLFDIEKKKAIPKLPSRIALVTASKAAALQDFLKIYKRRATKGEIELFPSLMQGEKAPDSIISALEKIRAKPSRYDLVIILRGGGSLEDLWAFNSEALTRYVFDFETPVISAIGHEVDYTLLDYVADLRCETPSAAAEVITKYMVENLQKIEVLKKRLTSTLRSFRSSIDERQKRIKPEYLKSLIARKIEKSEYNFENKKYKERLARSFRIEEKERYIDELSAELRARANEKVEKLENQMSLCQKSLGALDPKMVLERGYSYVSADKLKDKGGGALIIEKASQFKEQVRGAYTLHFSDGEVLIKEDFS